MQLVHCTCFLSWIETYGDEGDTQKMSFILHNYLFLEEKVFVREEYRKKLNTCDCFIFVADPRRVWNAFCSHPIEDCLRFVCRTNCVASSQLFRSGREQLCGYEARMALFRRDDKTTMRGDCREIQQGLRVLESE